MNRLQKTYQQEVVPKLIKEFSLPSSFAAPRILKLIVNMGVSNPQEPRARKVVIENVAKQFEVITGQKPIITKAKQSIAGFKLREGDPLGLKVTIRGRRMWEFLDKLISLALPGVKDFQGVSRSAFDGQGNYALGIKEQIIFPEIDYDMIEKVRGLQVCVVTNTKDNNQVFRLLELLGMPFEKEN